MPMHTDLLPGVPIVESPFFEQSLIGLDLTDDERRVARDLHERGLAIFQFPDESVDERGARIKERLAAHFGIDFAQLDAVASSDRLRVQDAWRFDEDVRSIAVNPAILRLLSAIYGRPAFPFQTLNFPVGTEQHLHTDAVHFSSFPERFMCGVWVALEDVHADAGPLSYLPSSHKWPILTNAHIGRRGTQNCALSAQTPFEAVWDALVAASPDGAENVLLRKGQAVIWAANLLHGGSPQHDLSLTRWSQVTHYYFKDCIYYTPAFSDEPFGRLALRTVTNVATGETESSSLLGEEMAPAPAPTGFFGRVRKRFEKSGGKLPEDFNADAYYRLNPDVAASGVDAANHYVQHGILEGRPYRSAKGSDACSSG